MSNGRRHKGEINYQEVQGTRSHQRKPPLRGCWQPTVPSWEKRFCYSVGLVPWEKLLETKKSMYLYENVVQWNDSAGEEAFHNAKNRFWAKINGVPCDISLPDPDIYIDEIDWNTDTDPELYLDLEREPKYPGENDKGKEVLIFDNSALLNQSFSCDGWGEAEDDLQKKAANTVLDPGYRDFDRMGNNVNQWVSNNVCKANHRENGWNDSYGWNNNGNEWRNVNEEGGREWGTWDANNIKREGNGWYMSRYKTSRFRGDEYQMDRGWLRNGRGRKRMNFVY